MFFDRCLTCFIIAFSLASCWAGKQIEAPAYYKNPAPADTSKLRFDGYYTNISETDYPQSKYTAVNEVFFTTKNKMFFSHGARTAKDSTLFTCKYYKELDPSYLGVYITGEAD